MPHIIVEHSSGIDQDLHINGLLDELLNVAKDIDASPLGGLRIRAVESSRACVGDGAPENQLIYIVVRLGRGRPDNVKKDVGDRLFMALSDYTQSYFDHNKPLSLGLELQEIDPDWTWKKNNVYKILKDKNNG